MVRTAKIFMNGHCQAVRLPKDFHIDSKEVAISHFGNGIILQPLLKSWLDVYHHLEACPVIFPDKEPLQLEDRDSLE